MASFALCVRVQLNSYTYKVSGNFASESDHDVILPQEQPQDHGPSLEAQSHCTKWYELTGNGHMCI